MQRFSFVISFAIVLSAVSAQSPEHELEQLDLNSLKEEAAHLPELLAGSAESGHDDSADQLMTDLERELTEAIFNVIASDDDEDSADTNLPNIDDMNQFISSLESEKELEDLASNSNHGGRFKRFTVDFMGMQVSYPQYLRLVKLQEKVIKLNQLIEALHARYTKEQLQSLPQYQRLMQLHSSLMPLLPQPMRDAHALSKRIPSSVDFLGMRVSFPQYTRLMALQEKVIKLDQGIRHLSATHSQEALEANPKWHTLLSMHDQLKKLLPPEYLAQHADAVATPIRRKRSPTSINFNGLLVSYPQYFRLMRLQEKTLKLDDIMRKLSEGRDPAQLADNPKWLELMSLRKSLQKILPPDHPTFELPQSTATVSKRGTTMEFNGIQVSYPQYLHLMSLQEKAMKLDAAMKKISENSSPAALAKNPKWNTLVELRQSLSKLLPMNQI